MAVAVRQLTSVALELQLRFHVPQAPSRQLEITQRSVTASHALLGTRAPTRELWSHTWCAKLVSIAQEAMQLQRLCVPLALNVPAAAFIQRHATQATGHLTTALLRASRVLLGTFARLPALDLSGRQQCSFWSHAQRLIIALPEQWLAMSIHARLERTTM